METAMPPSQVDRQTLYEADYLRWIETTVEKLRSQDYADDDEFLPEQNTQENG